MRVAIHQPNFLPWKGYFEKIKACDIFIFLDDVQFSKGSFTNRTKVLGPSGPRWLTVPVHRHLSTPINRVTVAEEFTAPLGLGTARAGDSLSQFNENLIKFLANDYPPKVGFVRASYLRVKPTSGATGLLELCRLVGATSYLSGVSGAKYGVPEAFAGSGVAVVPFEWKPSSELEKLSIVESLRTSSYLSEER